VATAVVAAVAVLGAFLLRRSTRSAVPAANDWQQLTFFTDSAVYPALSPDGRLLTFIRGSESFFGLGQIYVKFLPDGQPVQLTHDSTRKLSPTFSPDGSSIAYGTVEPWNTFAVPVLGGEPQMLLPNASSVSWIEGGTRLLFSEIKEGLHMAVVTSDEGRGQIRDVYVPPGQRSMAHHSFNGKGDVRVVGPPVSDVFPVAGLPMGNGSTSRLSLTNFTSGASVFPTEHPNKSLSARPRKKALRWPLMANR
jgi:hypothetical protein